MAEPPPQARPATRLVHAGRHPAQQNGLINPAPERGSTVLRARASDIYASNAGATYGRMGLSAQRVLADGLADLEQAHEVFLTPSGLSACTLALLAVVGPGDELLVVDCVYGPTRRFCTRTLRRLGVAVRFLPPDADAAAVAVALSPATRAVMLESPGSLTFEVQDLPGIAQLCRERDVLTLIDNTWAAGLLLKPLTIGIDISIQSLTKYVIGGSDWFGGAIAVGSAEVALPVGRLMQDLGLSLGPEEAYAGQRGLRSLEVRLRTQGDAGLALARWLCNRPEVAQVLHPGLPSHPQHARWQELFGGSAGLFSVVFHPTPPAAMAAFFAELTLFGHGFSWGGFESLVIPCDPQLERACSGPLDGPLVRLSVGLEDPADLIADLERGFAALGAFSGR
jgi:cystathionine beta-lyase